MFGKFNQKLLYYTSERLYSNSYTLFEYFDNGCCRLLRFRCCSMTICLCVCLMYIVQYVCSYSVSCRIFFQHQCWTVWVSFWRYLSSNMLKHVGLQTHLYTVVDVELCLIDCFKTHLDSLCPVVGIVSPPLSSLLKLYSSSFLSFLSSSHLPFHSLWSHLSYLSSCLIMECMKYSTWLSKLQ